MRKLLIVLAASLTLAATVVATTAATNSDPNDGHKITLCHRTGSADNPYVSVTVDIASSGFVQGGHTNHEQVGNGLGGDIIPAYEAFAKDGKEWVPFSYPGKNLDTIIGGVTGAEILAAGCQIPGGGVHDPTPIPPTYTPGNCDNPLGTVTVPDQPEGILVDTSTEGNITTVTFTTEEGFVFDEGVQTVYTFDLTVGAPTNCEPPCEETLAGQMLGCNPGPPDNPSSSKPPVVVPEAPPTTSTFVPVTL